jgi:hypothetical protein
MPLREGMATNGFHRPRVSSNLDYGPFLCLRRWTVGVMTVLTEHQAYAAMFFYLEKQRKRTKSNTRGGMLGDMSLLPDERRADAPVMGD